MQVVKAPDNRLRIITKPVKKITPGLEQITKEMIKLTLTFKDPEGVGLASTQIGMGEKFFVGKMASSEDPKKEEFKVFINPEILNMSKKTKTYFEGCLSIPDYYGETIRALNIKVRYKDLQGIEHIENLKGVNAWIFQHEVDHLNGILFPDRVLEQKGRFFKFVGKDKRGEDMFEAVTI